MSMNRYIIYIEPTGRFGRVHCWPGATLPLKDLQELVDGPIEIVPTVITKGTVREDDVRAVMIVNEEGKLRKLPKNSEACLIATLWPGDYIAGNALLMGARGEELVGFTEEAADRIISRWLEVGK